MKPRAACTLCARPVASVRSHCSLVPCGHAAMKSEHTSVRIQRASLILSGADASTAMNSVSGIQTRLWTLCAAGPARAVGVACLGGRTHEQTAKLSRQAATNPFARPAARLLRPL